MEQQTIIAICAAGLVVCTGFLFLGDKSASETKRVREFSGKKTVGSNLKEKLKVEDSGSRRKQIEETLGKIEERQKTKKKKAKSIESRLMQADWSMKPQNFMIMSCILAAIFGILPFILGLPPLACAGLAFVMGFGLPRFILNGDCLKIIAHESPDPLGSEFRRVVEGESLGIPIHVCLEQMYERMPISEVNFFSTVLNIQKTTGGNLGEALANLSSVLRGRKILREKIKALSAEAKVSSIIIGSLPVIVMLLVTIASPDYMNDLYNTTTGQRNMIIGVVMMVMGTLMMKKMINFKF